MVAAVNPAYGKKKVLDSFNGIEYPSQCAMVKAVFPGKNNFYMYKAYDLYPGRFFINGKQARGNHVVHWETSTQAQTMVNCGMDLTEHKSRDLSEVTCKNCLKDVNMSKVLPVFDELSALVATMSQWTEIAIYDLGINGKEIAPTYLETVKKYHLNHVLFRCFLCEFSNENPGSGDAHNCDHCPLRQELLDGLNNRHLPIQFDALCESEGAPWHDFKRHAGDEDPSDRYDIAMKVVSMCAHRIKELVKEKLCAGGSS
jgi:hypothetical protein